MYLLNLSHKSLSRRNSVKASGFTLTELLVVIGIIAILASIILVVSSSVIKAAKRAKAFNIANQIQTSALAYYTEYSIYPTPPTSPANSDYLLSDVSANKTAWGTLICILCGNVQPAAPGTVFVTNGATITNSRGIAFLNLKYSDVDSFNAPLNPLNYLVGTVTNNAYFNIAMDSDFDGIMGTNSPTSTAIPNFALSTTSSMNYTGTSTAGVIVWENCNGSATSTNPSFWVHTY